MKKDEYWPLLERLKNLNDMKGEEASQLVTDILKFLMKLHEPLRCPKCFSEDVMRSGYSRSGKIISSEIICKNGCHRSY